MDARSRVWNAPRSQGTDAKCRKKPPLWITKPTFKHGYLWSHWPHGVTPSAVYGYFGNNFRLFSHAGDIVTEGCREIWSISTRRLQPLSLCESAGTVRAAKDDHCVISERDGERFRHRHHCCRHVIFCIHYSFFQITRLMAPFSGLQATKRHLCHLV